jgi:single-stranded-DNA-specific exonuclease
MSDWQLSPTYDVPPDLLAFAGDPLLAQLLLQRGLTTVEQAQAFLDPTGYRPADPQALPDLDRAVARLEQAIARQELICVWGDFDVDGQTATALLVSTLAALGARVRYYIPDRLTESHGLKLPALAGQIEAGVKLIVTCDTGSDAHEAVEAAGRAGLEVIITDHHDLPDALPPALAILNPKRLAAAHPLAELPGVGVAYQLATGLYQAYGRAGEAEALLDLVALGIVADVARQSGDTRYLLQRGLQALQQTPRLGLQALIESARLRRGRLTEEHIGFWLAPRLNALGRLADANLGVELLITTNRSRARIIALQLEALNDRRKMLVERVVVQALGQIEDTPSLVEGRNAIVLAAADWHPGVIGIAANRLVNQFGKPAVLIALRADGVGRGSARSVPGCDIHQALKSQAERLLSLGGHPMAAGLSIAPEQIMAFRQGLSEALAGCRPATAKSVRIDAVIELAQISPDLWATIQRLAPFGAGNPPVQFGCRGLRIIQESSFGRAGENQRLLVEDEQGQQQTVIWWRGGGERSPQGRFDLAFSLTPPDQAGEGGVQLTWLAAREWNPPPVAASFELIDWRAKVGPPENLVWPDPVALSQAVIWAEGREKLPAAALPRHRLSPAGSLIVWSAPPDPDVFRQVVNRVRPHQIYVVGFPATFDAFPAFIKRLMGLIKHALSHKSGELILEEVAAALGQAVTTARLGIGWLEAQGKLAITVEEAELLVVRPAQGAASAEAEALEQILKAALAETAAYRQFFRQADLAALTKSLA